MSLQHWAFYICSAWRKPVENTNRAHSSSHCPLPVLSQQCHSAQEQRPPFCLAWGLKNQSHIQEIHPARISLTECLIVHGSAADLEGLPIFGAVEQPRAVACTDPGRTHSHTQSHRLKRSCHDLAWGFTQNNQTLVFSPCIPAALFFSAGLPLYF